MSGNPDPVITSTFEFPLDTLYFVDADGKAWTAGDVRQGRNTKLSPVADADFNAWVTRHLAMFARQNNKRLELTAKRKGHFVAASTSMPAIETLDAINWRQTNAVLTGPVLNVPTAAAVPAEAE